MREADEEVVRRNGGSWPDIPTKNERLMPLVVEEALAHDEVVLLNGHLPATVQRGAFVVVLLDVPDDELLRRHEQRRREEGWTNVEWFDWNRDHLRQVRADGWIDHVIDGTRPPDEVAAELAALVRAAG